MFLVDTLVSKASLMKIIWNFKGRAKAAKDLVKDTSCAEVHKRLSKVGALRKRLLYLDISCH
jgi:hypothetical protein